MNERTKELVGIAASIAGHCQPCFLYHLKEAEKLNISLKDIREAIELAKAISQSGDENMKVCRATFKKRIASWRLKCQG